jgi:hypothetical protein
MTRNEALARGLEAARAREATKRHGAYVEFVPYLEWKAEHRETGRTLARAIACGQGSIDLVMEDHHSGTYAYSLRGGGRSLVVHRNQDGLPVNRPYTEERARSRHGRY